MKRCVFIGYPFGKKGWRVYDLEIGDIFANRDLIFYEGVYSFETQIKGEHGLFQFRQQGQVSFDDVLKAFVRLRPNSEVAQPGPSGAVPSRGQVGLEHGSDNTCRPIEPGADFGPQKDGARLEIETEDPTSGLRKAEVRRPSNSLDMGSNLEEI